MSGRAASAEILARSLSLLVNRSATAQDENDVLDMRYLYAAVALTDESKVSGAAQTQIMRHARSALLAADDTDGVLERTHFALSSLRLPGNKALAVDLPAAMSGLRELMWGPSVRKAGVAAIADPNLTATAQALAFAAICRPCQWFSPDTGIIVRAGCSIRPSGRGFRLTLPWSHSLLRLSHEASMSVIKAGFERGLTEMELLDTLITLKDVASQSNPQENPSAASERGRDYVIYDYAVDAYATVERQDQIFADPVLTLAAATAVALTVNHWNEE
ncbi:hypothetical protein [Microvirga calopogonii]|uniref:hypothetical protein n=1 Tax=Microvirga calopogonii TaxID=2078013 RepID=UPI0013B36B08|nr:hypothetical protein [Microvirga calopogonii]